MNQNLAQARANISICFVEKDFSKYSVFPVIASYLLDHLNLGKKFEGVVKTEKINCVFSKQEYLLTLFTIIFLKIKRIYRADDVLSDEQVLAKILGIKKGKFPSASSIYQFLSLVDHWSVKRLDKINWNLIKDHKHLLSKRWVTIDIDQTKKITEGRKIEKAKPCYNPLRKGRLGLRITAGSIENLTLVQKLEPGNVGNADCFEKILTKMLYRLDEMFPGIKRKKIKICDRRIILRIDGGYYSAKTLKIIERYKRTRKLGFIVRAKNNLKIIKNIKKESKGKSWVCIDKIRGTKILRVSGINIIDNQTNSYTIVLIKDQQKIIKSKKKRTYHTKRKYDYALLTDLNNWSTKRIINYYKKRQIIEDIFKEHNQSFNANKLPPHKFWGNAFYFQMVSLAANISFFFKTHLSVKKVQAHNTRKN